MARARYRGPDFYRPHSTELAFIERANRGFTSPFNDAVPSLSSTRGYSPTSSYDRRYATCIHEAGHAVCAVMRGKPLYEVVIFDDETAVCRAYPPPSPTFDSTKIDYIGLCEDLTTSKKNRDWAFDLMVSYAAGFTAQARVDPCADRIRDGSESDRERARILAESVTSSDGEAQDLLHEARREAEEIIDDNWRYIENIARALYATDRLDEDGVRRAMFGDQYRSPEERRAQRAAPAASSDDRPPLYDRGPSAIGLSAAHDAVGQERAGSPYDEHLFRLRVRFLEGRL